jgi:septum site-determining protein MinD
MSERTVYAIASGKGGVGKTTTAINLGAMLADRDHSVVVVDTDLGMANLADFLDFEVETPTLHEVLAGDADAEDAIHRAPGGIDVLPTATDIEAFTRSDAGNLEDVVAPLRDEYDVVLLDTGAGVSYDTLVPLALADAVLLVATPDVASVRDTAKTGKLAARVESEVAGAVLTQRSSDILNADDVEATLGTDVLAVVPQDEAVPMGIDAGRPLAGFAPNAPAGQAYRELAAVVTGETAPDPELDLGGGADVAFDAEPPRRTDESEREEPKAGEVDPLSGEEIGENVRDTVANGDESGGLLGGQLASVADEIREEAASRPTDRQAADEPVRQPDQSPGGHAGEAPGSEAVEAGGADAEKGDFGEGDAVGNDSGEVATERTDFGGADAEESETESGDEDEPRSVDDLINEHMGDDRLGGDGTFDGDDPLGGGDSPAGVDDDSLGGMDEDSPGETDDGASNAGEDANEEPGERAAPESAASDDGSESGSIPFEDESEPPSAEAGDRAPEPKAESDAEPESIDPGRVESGDAEAEDVKTGTLADEDDGNGILGRLGSLFK